MPTTLKLLRELNDYTQDFVAEEVLGISQNTYSRLEREPSRLSAEQAQKLSELYKVGIATLLSEATPIVTFESKSISENHNCGNNGFAQTQHNQFDEGTVKSLQAQNELLIKQNEELMQLVKVLGGKLAND